MLLFWIVGCCGSGTERVGLRCEMEPVSPEGDADADTDADADADADVETGWDSEPWGAIWLEGGVDDAQLTVSGALQSQFGWSLAVSEAGEDGLLVAARGDDELGPDRGAVFRLTAPGYAPELVFRGELDRDFAGQGLGVLGDAVLIGAPGHDHAGARSGRSYLLRAEEVQAIDGEAAQDYSGSVITSLGDLDGDGLDELLITAYGHDTSHPEAGASYVLTAETLDAIELLSLGSADAKVVGLDSGDYSGSAAVALGDLDGDGVPEWAIGTPNDDRGAIEAGSVAIFSGLPEGLVTLDEAVSTLLGDEQAGYFGDTLALVGDLDGDGIPDLGVASTGSDRVATNGGAVQVYAGASLTEGGTLSYELLGGTKGLRLGWTLAGAGDMNGDGLADLATAAPYEGNSNRGQVWVTLGPAAGQDGTEDPEGHLVGWENDALFGLSIVPLGDLDGDGHGELAIGSPGEGAVYLFYGRP